MRRFAATLLTLVLFAGAASAYSPRIREISIDVTLLPSGTALVQEEWDVCVASGTEWYLVRENLGDIRVGSLSVCDETGTEYVNEGGWDINRSLAAKAGRCGIVQKSDGVEICWGVGSMGHHTYRVTYEMTNAVKSLNDYDMLHLQLVSPGLSSRPEKVSARISAASANLSTDNTRIWGFGFDGESGFSGGAAVYTSDGKFKQNSSLIALLRFDKGIFNSSSTRSCSFDSVLNAALDGADFSDDSGFGEILAFFAMIFFCFFLPLFAGIFGSRREKKKILGMKPADVLWQRDIPFGGDLLKADYVMTRLGEVKKQNTLASAIILRMVYDGFINVTTDADGKVELAFAGYPTDADSVTRGLFDMMMEASGSDLVLQDKEFSRWAGKNKARIRKWGDSFSTTAEKQMQAEGLLKGTKFTEKGQEGARGTLGFKKFLEDFTLVKERGTSEAVLWREYLVFASLFGIADKVAKELKDIDPTVFDEVMPTNYDTTRQIVLMSDSLSRSITNVRQVDTSGSMARGGFGGHTSFGGGGGFSGGGFGGGSR